MNVKDLSWFIIRRCYKNGEPITHLQLQRLLYSLQVESIKLTDKPLFNADLHIKSYMPVVQKVFNEFNIYSSVDIIPTKYDPNPNIELNNDLLKVIDDFCNIKFFERKLTDDKWETIKQFEKISVDDIRRIYKYG